MYYVTELPNGRGLTKDKYCRKIFTSEGKLVKFNKNGNALLPKDAKISVNRFLHYVKHSVDMATNRSILWNNAVMEKYGIGEKITIDEEEKILASLECEENI